MNDITIIITSFKSGEKINNCLNSINNQCKVLLIENSNDIEFKKKIEKKFTNVECFLTGENLGYGKANNIGLKKTTTKYALILNPDAYLEKNTIENFLQSASEIPNFAIMAPYVQEEKNNNTQDIHANTKPKEVINVKGFAMFLNMNDLNIATVGRLSEDSVGNDSTTGHWELAGLTTKTKFSIFENGFPQELIQKIEKEASIKKPHFLN